ncbi:MAG: lysophospholipid acyltransferase family protein [Bacteroidetes bacterium]|nr:lysophospholipid acyltransferase family protein [Bacteroidota bacterium]
MAKMSTGFRLTVYPLLWCVSMLPFPVLYLLSDFICFLLYRVVGYRKTVVRTNLANSFPEKTELERLRIERLFYSHLADMMLETIKGMTISAPELLRRMKLLNTDVLQSLVDRHRSAIIVMSHCGNWEWVCLAADITSPQNAQCVYKTLSNANWDAWFLQVRSRFGTQPHPMEKILRVMASQKNEVNVTAFIGDQNPSNGQNAYWTRFLGQDTCFMTGSEKIARKLDQAVYYMQVVKVKRGFYECTLSLLCDESPSSGENEITEAIVRATESDIRQQPQHWLWSHRRWKHKRN